MRGLDNYSPKPRAYSAKNISKPTAFLYMGTDAQKVTIMGDFNDWDPEANPMKQQFDGAWRGEVMMSHGHHHYLFCVDGKPTLDPRAQGTARNEKGEKVSLISVS